MNTALSAISQRLFDVYDVRKDFPILTQQVNGHPLVYLDNAATTQKPIAVIDAISNYYKGYNSNVHRGSHFLSDKATHEFEAARQAVSEFINSPKSAQVIWTRGTTEGINLVASTWGRENIKADDIILVSTLEHHSNIVPWQMLANETGAKVVPMAVSNNGEIDLVALNSLLADTKFAEAVKLIAVNYVSNALGTINPIKEIVELAQGCNAKVVVDGAQAVAHFPVDVQDLGCDFFTFSGHKLYGPTGIGVLWGKEALLNAMSPYQGGGEMIERVSFSGTSYNELPYKFEAGTPDIAGAIGLGAAIHYLSQFDRSAIVEHEHELLEYTIEKSAKIKALTRVGTSAHSVGVFSFLIDGAHPSDVGLLLDQQGIAVRTGHHCAQPLMEAFEIPGTVRASFSMYNTKEDVDALFTALDKVLGFLV
jgi:cysteine desulfurase/selenocysteine lyase